MRVVVTGISGSLGRLLALRLLERGHEVLGIDRRPWPECPRAIELVACDIRKRPAEDLLRMRTPDALVHLATVAHFEARYEERARINLGGTRTLLTHCHRHGVKQFLFVGRHTVYGATPDAPLYHAEDDPPLALSTSAELADLCAADLFAGTALWRWPSMRTAVLRVVYTLGPSTQGPLARLLAAQRVPAVLGFDPLVQFIHEDDCVRALIVALEAELRGVFNVAGPSPLPLSLLAREVGARCVPLPEPLHALSRGRFGFPSVAVGDIAHLKYPVLVDDAIFRSVTGFTPSFDEQACLRAAHEARRALLALSAPAQRRSVEAP